MQQQEAFSLLETLIAIAVVSILVVVGLPSMNSFMDRSRVVSAAEQVYSHLQQARIESISRSNNVTVNISAPGTNAWVYGFAQRNDGCTLTITDPTTANACFIVIDDGDGVVDGVQGNVDTDDRVLTRFEGSDFDSVVLRLSNFSNGTLINFDSLRGISDSGDLLFVSDEGKQLKIRISRLGLIRICSPDGSVSGYSTVDC